MTSPDKGREVSIYYEREDTVDTYDTIRFHNIGGQYVDATERKIISALIRNHPKDQPILEVAPGTGRFSLHLARQGFHVIAVDFSGPMLEKIRKSSDQEGLRIDCVEADAFNLPFQDNSFETVYSVRFVWHFSNYPKILQEFARVSRRGVVFDMMNSRSLAALTAPFANYLVYRSIYTETATQKELKNAALEAGLKLNTQETAFFFPYIFYRRLPVLTPIMRHIDSFAVKHTSLGSVFYSSFEKFNAVQDQI